MSILRIREIEDELRKLERELCDCTEKERYDIKSKIDELNSELRRIKRREEEEEEEGSMSLLGLGMSSFGSGGFDHGFGGGGFGGGGSGGSW